MNQAVKKNYLEMCSKPGKRSQPIQEEPAYRIKNCLMDYLSVVLSLKNKNKKREREMGIK